MSTWADKLQNSSIYTKARQILDAVTEDRKAETQPAVMEALDRVSHVATMLVSTLDVADPELVADPTLVAIGNNLDNVIAYLNNWRQSRDASYITVHIQNALDGVLMALGQIPGVNPGASDKMMKSLRGAVAGHRLAVSNATTAVNQALQSEKAAFERNAQQAADEVKKLSERTATVEGRLDKVEESSQTIITQQQAAFAKAETSRAESFSLQVAEQKKSLEGSIGAIESDAAAKVDKIKTSLDAQQKKAEASQEKIEQIMGVVGQTALIGNYSRNAKNDLVWSLVWSGITVASIGGAIWIASALAQEVANETPNPYYVFVKIFLTITVGGLVAYAARQASEHRQAQRDAEQMALQLAALPLYLNEFKDLAKRDAVLTKVALRLFGNRVAKNQKKVKGDEELTIDSAVVGKTVIEAVKVWLKDANK